MANANSSKSHLQTVSFRCIPCDHTFSAQSNYSGPLTGFIDTCPECNCDAEALYCEACGMHSPDLDDKCRHCVASEYITGVADLAHDRVFWAAAPWWPKVEVWVAQARAQMEQERSDGLSAFIRATFQPVASRRGQIETIEV